MVANGPTRAARVLAAARASKGSAGGADDVGGEGGGAMRAPDGVPREDYAAVCCAIQNVCLSFHAEGLGTKWTTGPVNFDARFAAAAGLPEGEEVVGTLWFGTPQKVPSPPKRQLGVAEVRSEARPGNLTKGPQPHPPLTFGG